MAEFKNLAELEKYLNDKIRKALSNEVATVASETMSDHVMSDVYSRYEPSQYIRSGDLYKDIKTEMVNDNTLTIENVTKDEETGRYIAPIVEDGIGYEWKDSRIYHMQPFPRPFVEETAKELEKGLAREALKEGLNKQGLIVE